MLQHSFHSKVETNLDARREIGGVSSLQERLVHTHAHANSQKKKNATNALGN